MVYYLILFLSGYVILSTPQIAKAIRNQRRYYSVETVLTVIAMFTLPGLLSSESISGFMIYFTESAVAWSCGMAALGYARHYLNMNNRFRNHGG